MSLTTACNWVVSQLAFGAVAVGGHALFPTSGEAMRDGRAAFVHIGEHRFEVAIAASQEDQIAGLGGRGRIAPNAGMLFLMPSDEYQSFSMRDCAVPLDLIYVDRHLRVVSIHEMQPEPARTDAERTDDPAYLARLKGYVSEVPVSMAIELRGGRAAELGIREGDTVLLPRTP